MHSRCKGQNRNVSGPFDGNGDLSLVFGAISRDSSGNDLSPFRHKVSEGPWILVINLHLLVGAKPTDLPSHKGFLFFIGGWLFTRFFHRSLLSKVEIIVSFGERNLRL